MRIGYLHGKPNVIDLSILLLHGALSNSMGDFFPAIRLAFAVTIPGIVERLPVNVLSMLRKTKPDAIGQIGSGHVWHVVTLLCAWRQAGTGGREILRLPNSPL